MPNHKNFHLQPKVGHDHLSTKKRGDDRHVHGDGALLGDWPQLWAVHESPCGLTDTLVGHNIKWIQEAAEDSEEDVEYQELPDTVRRGFPNETRKVKDAVKSYLGVWEHSSFVPFFRLNCQEGKLAFESKFGLESDYPLILSLIYTFDMEFDGWQHHRQLSSLSSKFTHVKNT